MQGSRDLKTGRITESQEQEGPGGQKQPYPGTCKGNYHNDYSPRYDQPYDIYEKARQHVKMLRRNKKNSG